ncbi:hypothetical protein RND81_07G074000 [Saponaria officinalis]|uniref:Ubiquinone biosynthesis protein n=1 Tax=Saponaria officinalis TaxID=3572 RepID=A0AAW1JPY5_SAPOF
MYRTAVNRLLLQTFRSTTARRPSLSNPTVNRPTIITSSSSLFRFCSSSTLDSSFSPQNPKSNNPDNSEFTDSSSSSKTTSEKASGSRPVTEFQEEQSRVLQASLRHVNRLGWGEAAMMAGAREVGVSPSIVGSFPRKEAALVEYFMDECLENLIDIIESSEDLKNLIPSERIAKLLKTRLEMQAPYIVKWPQALSIQALPANVPTSFKQRAALVDEIWHVAGDESSDLDWYAKRTVLGGIYSTTEIYMLTDKSPDFRDTWAFLNSRIRDAFDLKKTLQEAQYLVETVGAGLGGSLQGLVKGLKL